MKIEISSNDKDLRIDTYLSEQLENQTRNSVQILIENNHIKVNEKNIKKNYRLCEGDVIEISLPEVIEIELIEENIPLNIVFEDDDIIVINKPKNLVVHPAPGHPTGTLVNALMYHCKDSLSGINGELRPGIVHRIDKDTSGLLVVAKNDNAHLSLSNQISTHSAKRIYHAIVFGNVREDFGTINTPIGRHKTDRKKISVNTNSPKSAVTNYKVLLRFNGYTYIECALETGRTHQIRVHMQSIGHPIVGDNTYTTMKSKFNVDSQCLHAKKLSFNHPKSLENLTFETELPEYFQKIIDTLK